MAWEIIGWIIGGGLLLLIAAGSVVMVRPTERGLIERMGKYHRYVSPGLSFKIPLLDSVIKINITECMVNASQQQVITKDNLNAIVDAQVYFKVMTTEDDVKASQYNVNDYETQIVALARTTMRDIIGQMVFKDVNSKREDINNQLAKELKVSTKNWGIEIVRTELKEIEPPKDVQDTMNQVIKAENTKIAALDFATATETNADGAQRAVIKNAEGEARAIELVANARANAIKAVSEASTKYFQGSAQIQRQLEVVENTLGQGAVYVLSPDSPILSVLPLQPPGKTPKARQIILPAGAVPTVANMGTVKKKKKEDEE